MFEPNENSVIGRYNMAHEGDITSGKEWGEMVSEAAKEYGGIKGHFRNNE